MVQNIKIDTYSYINLKQDAINIIGKYIQIKYLSLIISQTTPIVQKYN